MPPPVLSAFSWRVTWAGALRWRTSGSGVYCAGMRSGIWISIERVRIVPLITGRRASGP